MSAATQDGTYPRPQLVRPRWTSLDGEWGFAVDDADLGRSERWWADAARFGGTILVPFAPESEASGIGDDGRHPVLWYRRAFAASADGGRVLLHFGAVDQDADVWVDGRHVGGHVGGQTAFSLDVTDALEPGDEHVVVVRAFDDPEDPEIPRGKQDWRPEPHGIWYRRTSGIWRTVWLERVPGQHVTALHWASDIPSGVVTASVFLARPAAAGSTVRVALELSGEPLAAVQVAATTREVVVPLELPALRNAHERERLLWSPEQPTLVDARIEVDSDGEHDVVGSYLGIRSVGTGRGAFLLNGRPRFLTSVLEQGYWRAAI